MEPSDQRKRAHQTDTLSTCITSVDMSFVLRGTRGDIENGFPGFIPERRSVRVHATRLVNTNSMAFLVMILTSH